MKKSLLFLLILFLLQLQISAQTFEDFFTGTQYSELQQKVTPLEFELLAKVEHPNGTPRFNDKLIKLYLVASEINTEPEFSKYLNQFEELVTKARKIDGLSSLNTYNKAERLLHFLHDESFTKEITGPGAGYNIGIRETLDQELYNCYKSALIYNALLEYFDIRSSLVMVPEHIYSIVYIDDKEVEVETTTRYGFDPNKRGLPDFTRKFDKPNIIGPKPSYSRKRPIDNVSVVSSIYSNRMLVYSGRGKFTHRGIAKDLQRAGALGLIGFYITPGEKALSTNIDQVFQDYAEESTNRDISRFETEYQRNLGMLKRTNPGRINKLRARNLSIFVADNLKPYRQYRHSNLAKAPLSEINRSYIESLILLEKYSLDPDITDYGWGITMNDYFETLKNRITINDIRDLETFAKQCKELFDAPEFEKSSAAYKYRKDAERMATINLHNYLVVHMNSGNLEKAYNDANRGIALLKEELKFYNPKLMRTVEQNRDAVKAAMQQ